MIVVDWRALTAGVITSEPATLVAILPLVIRSIGGFRVHDRPDQRLPHRRSLAMSNESAFDLDLVDSHAGEVRDADLIFIFGTRHWVPAELAAELHHTQRARFVVVTGGPDRHPRGMSEAVVHQRLLVSAGVPEAAVIVENRSTTTVENVTLSAPLIAEVVGEVRSVIAVVKWYHRRALVTLAAHAPKIERIYAADYEPFNADSRTVLGRRNWAEFSPGTVERETRYMRDLAARGFDLLQRTDAGWIRTRESS